MAGGARDARAADHRGRGARADPLRRRRRGHARRRPRGGGAPARPRSAAPPLRRRRDAHLAGPHLVMPARFPMRFTGMNRAMVLLGIVPEHCRAEVDDAEFRVRMNWAFQLDAPRAYVREVAPDHGPVWGWGAHGWRGSWLVNGSSSGLVRIEFDPPVRARTAGMPVRVRVLRVSVVDPDALVAALSA